MNLARSSFLSNNSSTIEQKPKVNLPFYRKIYNYIYKQLAFIFQRGRKLLWLSSTCNN